MSGNLELHNSESLQKTKPEGSISRLIKEYDLVEIINKMLP